VSDEHGRRDRARDDADGGEQRQALAAAPALRAREGFPFCDVGWDWIDPLRDLWDLSPGF